ncbi:MAG: formylglycine-generating enzyme family protein [Polyangiales bacterium]
MLCRWLLPLLVIASSSVGGCKKAHSSEQIPVLETRTFGREIALPAPSVSASASAPPAACPVGMALVEGNHCPVVEHTCKRWLDPVGKFHFFRCAEYEEKPACKSERVPMRFCIDVNEAGVTSADPRPANHVTFTSAKASCEARGARLCKESEWEFACEGEEALPYPYGWKRQSPESAVCNVDRENVVTPNKKAIYDLRHTPDEDKQCLSPFGVRDMAGNLEEWVVRDRHELHTKTTLLKGSWWMKGRHTCRFTNGGHDDWYQGRETGYRCCKDAE